MDISKKELLKETGISYGQLYRWKREGLIPEEWFLKRCASTGQETFLPREKILPRIAAIQRLKEHYSLEEMAKLLTPEVSNALFCEEELEQFSEIDIEIAADFMDALEKDVFRFHEIVVMSILSEWKRRYPLDKKQLSALIEGNAKNLEQLEGSGFQMILMKLSELYCLLLVKESKQTPAYLLDERIQVIETRSIQEVGERLKQSYQSVFPLTAEEEELK